MCQAQIDIEKLLKNEKITLSLGAGVLSFNWGDFTPPSMWCTNITGKSGGRQKVVADPVEEGGMEGMYLG